MSLRSLAILVVGWLVSVAYMLLAGRTDAVTIFTDVVAPLLVLALGWLSTRMAPATPAPVPLPHESRARLVVQLSVLCVVIALTGARGISAHGLAFPTIPGWSVLVDLFGRAGDAVGIGANQGINFGTYVLVPGIFVLILGARLGEIGFARTAPRTGRIAIAWLALPALAWIIALSTGRVTVGFMLYQIVRNFFSNGFSEEFLWRGLLFTRLRGFLATDGALWIQALLFGLWHFGYDYTATPHHSLSLMFADMFASQVIIGYGLGWLMLRTRNIALPTAFHLGFDSIGNALG